MKYAGRVGTGFTTTVVEATCGRSQETPDRQAAVRRIRRPAPKRRGVTWVKPELVGEVEFTEWTSDGRLRHPSFHGLREDKPATEVIREMPKMPQSNRRQRKVGTHNRTIGQPADPMTQSLWPASGSRTPIACSTRKTRFTKRDVAEYYERIADWILPHVVDRPLTLVRCPEGTRASASFRSILPDRFPTQFAA